MCRRAHLVFRPHWRLALGAGSVLGVLLLPGAAFADHPAADWFNAECTAGQSIRCWQPIPNLTNPVRDISAAAGDASKRSTPNPSSADLWSGTSGTLNTVFFGYDDRGTATADDDVMFFRMRLLDTPLLAGGSGTPATNAGGPFDSNTAWNFLLDINGDGWVDFLNATDGNTGKTQDPFDNMQLGRNTSTTQQDITNGNLCTAGGQILWVHKSIDTALAACASATAAAGCDFEYTRVVNQTSTGGGYVLDMQFPLSVFDACSGTDTDGDGIGGAQLLTPTTPFTFCATTSTQPNDPTAKDLGYTGTYSMDKTTRLPCGDACSLAGGCRPEPVLVDLAHACGVGTNGSPIRLTASVLDTLVPNAGGTDVVDTIANVRFFYRQDGTPTTASWIPVTAAAGSANPVTAPASQSNLWSMQWNTSGISTSPTSLYWVRVDVTDDQGNVTSTVPFRINLSNCSVAATPVTLASFEAARHGGRVRAEWTTATEAGNVGFNVYAETAAGWRRLNRQLIPSRTVDAVEPQTYAFEIDAAEIAGAELYLEDVDVTGQTRLHGPFRLGGTHGRPAAVERVDWAAIRGEHEAKAAERRARGPRRGEALVRQAASAVAATPAPVALSVDRDGLYRLTFEALAAAGFDWSGVRLADIALTERGAPVPVHVGGRGATFGPGAFIEFHGRALDTLYTGTNVYTLSVDRRNALRAATAPGRGASGTEPAFYMETVEVERDLAYSFGSPTGDPWYDTGMLAFTSPAEWTFDLPVDGYVAGAAPVTLTVDVWGVTNWPASPDHHLVVGLNGQQVADVRFDGLSRQRVRVVLPAGLLREGANTLALRLPGDTGVSFDLVNLEGYSVEYPRSFAARAGALTFASAAPRLRVTGLTSPEVVVYRDRGSRLERLERVAVTAAAGAYTAAFDGSPQTATYLVTSADALLLPGIAAGRDGSTATASGAAQYLVLSHADFLDGLAPLVREREAQGLSVRVVDVADVYARFGHGVFDAQAIREYVAWAAANLATEYVLLVGGDTYDYRNVLGLGSISFVPSLYAPTGPIVRFAPADPLYADVDGDGVQDLAIGRLPVRTAAELDAVIAKTLAYGRKGYPRTAVFAADQFDATAGVSFAEISERFVSRLPAGWTAASAYLDALGVAGARAALVGAVEQGAALTSFVGHSGPTIWTFSGLFDANDAAALANTGRPTVVSQWGCWNTYYVSPTSNTMSHKLLLSGDRGAAAVLGASTLTQVESDVALGALLSPRLVEPGATIGKAIVAAKRELAATQPGLADVLVGWTVLGDPALAIDP